MNTDTDDHRQDSKPAKFLTWNLLIGVILAIASFHLFMEVLEAVQGNGQETVRIDRSILLWLHAHQRHGFTEAAEGLAFLGSPPWIVTIGALSAVAGFFTKKIRGAAWTLPVGIAGAGLIIQLTKVEVHRVRPTLFAPLLKETGYSFPSGHSLIAMVVYGLIGYFLMHLLKGRVSKTVVATLTVLIIVAIGVSRSYVGVHYPSDVLAGWAGGFPWLVTCMGLHEILSRRYAKAGEPVLAKPPPLAQAVSNATDKKHAA
ncbi:phosphatase PAP2 family protein [Capsulimonas corticalis]|uniref:Phosphatase PAP2 family protein n=1 Tax=Capsulimonas corticalis TaxID=2219043 RepID=A0A402D778_9BACT|nr:phosphatase PAP2 family protein [Capsulimonas corticalis]BDI29128.1 phosphatase PAP2 family protein [Capsulimonas corticalis]